MSIDNNDNNSKIKSRTSYLESYNQLKNLHENSRCFPTDKIYYLSTFKDFDYNGITLQYDHREFFLIQEDLNSDNYSETIRGFALQLTGENAGSIVKFSRENHFNNAEARHIPEIKIYTTEDGKDKSYFYTLYFDEKFKNIKDKWGETGKFYKMNSTSQETLQSFVDTDNSQNKESTIQVYDKYGNTIKKIVNDTFAECERNSEKEKSFSSLRRFAQAKYVPTNMVYALGRQKEFDYKGNILSCTHSEYFLIQEDLNQNISETLTGYALQLTGENSGQIFNYTRENLFDPFMSKNIQEVTVFAKEDGQDVQYAQSTSYRKNFRNIKNKWLGFGPFSDKTKCTIDELNISCEQSNQMSQDFNIEVFEAIQSENQSTM